MNVYEVVVSSEASDHCDQWKIGATSPGVAIRKVLARTVHVFSENVDASCKLIAKNISYKDWKAANKSQKTKQPKP